MGGELILVTGGSGFIGARCILQLLEARYRKKQARHERKGPARPRLDAAVKWRSHHRYRRKLSAPRSPQKL